MRNGRFCKSYRVENHFGMTSKIDRNELIKQIDRFQLILEKAFLREKLSGSVIGVVQGGLTVTITVFCADATISDLGRILKLGAVLAHESGVEAVRVYRNEYGLCFEFPSPSPFNPHAANLAPYMQPTELCIGFDGQRAPIIINMRRNPNIIFIGAPRVGKTSAVRSIVYSTLKQLNADQTQVTFLILAEKLHYWRAFIGRRGVVGVHSAVDEISLNLHQLSHAVGVKAKVGEIFDPPVYLVLDDLLRLISQDKSIISALSEILSTGASVGVFVLFITQSGGTVLGTGGAVIEDTVACRVIYKQTSNAAAARATGADATGLADLTSFRGDCVVILNATPVRAVTAFVEDSEIMQLPSAPTSPLFDTQKRGERLEVGGGTNSPLGSIYAATPHPSPLDLALPKINPARALTKNEVTRIQEILQFFVNSNKPLSRTFVVQEVFGHKNSTNWKYMDVVFAEN